MDTAKTLGKPSTMEVLEGNPCPECGFDHGKPPSPRLSDFSTATYVGTPRAVPAQTNEVGIIVDEFDTVQEEADAIPTEDS